jgi:hypothetical protein
LVGSSWPPNAGGRFALHRDLGTCHSSHQRRFARQCSVLRPGRLVGRPTARAPGTNQRMAWPSRDLPVLHSTSRPRASSRRERGGSRVAGGAGWDRKWGRPRSQRSAHHHHFRSPCRGSAACCRLPRQPPCAPPPPGPQARSRFVKLVQTLPGTGDLSRREEKLYSERSPEQSCLIGIP